MCREAGTAAALQAIRNLFLAIPNLLGGLLSCASLLVCFMFPRYAHLSPMPSCRLPYIR